MYMTVMVTDRDIPAALNEGGLQGQMLIRELARHHSSLTSGRKQSLCAADIGG